MKSGWFMSALNSVFTPVNMVNLCLRISFTKPGMSRGLVMRMLQPPAFIMSRQFAVSDRMW